MSYIRYMEVGELNHILPGILFVSIYVVYQLNNGGVQFVMYEESSLENWKKIKSNKKCSFKAVSHAFFFSDIFNDCSYS